MEGLKDQVQEILQNIKQNDRVENRKWKKMGGLSNHKKEKKKRKQQQKQKPEGR